MAFPPPVYAATEVGLNPSTAGEVNYTIGNHLRQFVSLRETIMHDHDGLAPLDLKAEPYLMSAEDETLLKTAINGLNTALQEVDMTFINRLTGLW